jgi:hypothetical protein
MRTEDTMKKKLFSISLIIGILLISLGCTTTQTATGQATNTTPVVSVGQVDIPKLAKTAGMIVATEYPEFTAEAVPYAKGLLEMAKSGTLSDADLAKAIKRLNEKMGNNAKWVTTIALVLSSVNIKVQAGTVNDQIVQALQGFIDGMSVFTVTPT